LTKNIEQQFLPLRGATDESVIPPVRRTHSYHSRSSALLENVKVKNLQFGIKEGNSTSKDWSKCKDSPDGSANVDGKTNQSV
jgi:hypothetical protein